MTKRIAESELILNPDGSVYHLKLRPENIANTIITVGDQARVSQVTRYFDTIDFSTQKREFKTETGSYKGKRITVISTGIGPDNIDIVFNELDALVNIDLETRTAKEEQTPLDFIRIGTSGSIQQDIPVDSFVISEYGLGLDGMIYSYHCDHILEKDIDEAFIKHVTWNDRKAKPYVVKCSPKLRDQLKSNKTFLGCTATADGFYGPQGRILRLPIQDNRLNNKMDDFNYQGIRITNFEMETAAIYGMSKLLGHNALSMNAIIANRANGNFSKAPRLVVEKLIRYTLNKLVA
ncbi:MAG: nucleoside phosphorylase [Flavobacteriaceae bacterium]|nr:nucleoside phosphorylase [Flavobacteriaceae bacterium]